MNAKFSSNIASKSQICDTGFNLILFYVYLCMIWQCTIGRHVVKPCIYYIGKTIMYLRDSTVGKGQTKENDFIWDALNP